MNYLEELAYWYFRFNGYFLINNFVNHKDNIDLDHTYETDFLGIRLPNVFEAIGGNNNDYDENITSESKIMCVMGESKSGRFHVDKIFKSKEVIKNNILRFGLLPSNDITEEIVEHLYINNSWENEKIKIFKVLVAENEVQNKKYIYISKNTIIDDFTRRKNIYRKNKDKIHFGSNLAQYLFS